MANEFEFKAGETYANRRETYTVLAVEPPNMRVRFEDGREGVLEIATQGRIIRNMKLPPAVPEPPPRTSRATAARTAAAKAASAATTRQPATRAATTRSRKAPASEAAGDGATAKPAASRTRHARTAPVSDMTLAQLCALPRDERRDQLGPLLETKEAFDHLIELSMEAERGRFRLFTPEHVGQLQSSDLTPPRSEPELLLSYALAANRGYLDGDGQPILSRRYPLLEGGVERYVIDLLAYSNELQTPIVVETRVKSTQRQWLWEVLLEGLRNWVGFSRAANLDEVLTAHRCRYGHCWRCWRRPRSGPTTPPPPCQRSPISPSNPR